MKKILFSLLCLLITSITVAAQPPYAPHKVVYTKQMNSCLSCTNTKYAALKYPVMGGYVLVDGKKLWVEQYGKGRPAVIFFNGGGESTRQWNPVIPQVAKYTTVIAYDRQGLGRSQTIDLRPRSAEQVVTRLQEILHKIHAQPPYVLVAHSIGGFYLSYFARRYPKQVAGMVTIDADNRFQVYWDQLNTAKLKPGSKEKLKAMTDPSGIKRAAMKQVNRYLHQAKRSPVEQARMIEELRGCRQATKCKTDHAVGAFA